MKTYICKNYGMGQVIAKCEVDAYSIEDAIAQAEAKMPVNGMRNASNGRPGRAIGITIKR